MLHKLLLRKWLPCGNSSWSCQRDRHKGEGSWLSLSIGGSLPQGWRWPGSCSEGCLAAVGSPTPAHNLTIKHTKKKIKEHKKCVDIKCLVAAGSPTPAHNLSWDENMWNGTRNQEYFQIKLGKGFTFIAWHRIFRQGEGIFFRFRVRMNKSGIAWVTQWGHKKYIDIKCFQYLPEENNPTNPTDKQIQQTTLDRCQQVLSELACVTQWGSKQKMYKKIKQIQQTNRQQTDKQTTLERWLHNLPVWPSEEANRRWRR